MLLRRNKKGTHQVLLGHRRQDETKQGHDEVSFPQRVDGLGSRAVLEGNKEVLALASDESDSLR